MLVSTSSHFCGTDFPAVGGMGTAATHSPASFDNRVNFTHSTSLPSKCTLLTSFCPDKGWGSSEDGEDQGEENIARTGS